jgi:hypothetical protein
MSPGSTAHPASDASSMRSRNPRMVGPAVLARGGAATLRLEFAEGFAMKIPCEMVRGEMVGAFRVGTLKFRESIE